MKKLLLLIFASWSFFISGQTVKKSSNAAAKVDLYINSNQCYNCNIALQALNYLADTIQKTIFLSETNKAVADEMLFNYKKIKNLTVKYYSTVKGPFHTSSLIPSFCLVNYSHSKIDSFELKDLYYKSAYINMLGSKPVLKNSIVIHDSIRFSDRINAGYSSGYYNVYDYTVNKNVLLELDKTTKKITGNFTVRSKDFNPQLFLRSGIIDTAMYRVFKPVLNYLGKTETHIDNFYLADSCLNLILNFPCPLYVEKDTGVGGQLFLYSKNLKTLKSYLLPTPVVAVPGPNKEEYFLDNVTGFYVKNNTYRFSLLALPAGSKTHIIGEYHKNEKGYLEFLKFMPYQVSDTVYNDYGRSTNNFATATNAKFYFAQCYPYIVPLSGAEPVIIKALLPTALKNDLWIQDVTEIDKNYIKVLYTLNKKTCLLIYSVYDNKIMLSVPVSFPEAIDIYTLKFIDALTLIGMKKKYKELAIFKLN